MAEIDRSLLTTLRSSYKLYYVIMTRELYPEQLEKICSFQRAILKNCLIGRRLRWNRNASRKIAGISQTILGKMRHSSQ